MRRAKKTKTVNPVKPDAEPFPLIICKAKSSVPSVRTVKSKEKDKAATTNPKCLTNTGEKSGDLMKICVNLMPLLAAAKEPMEEKEDKAADCSCMCKKEAELSSKDDPSDTKSEEQLSLSNTEFSSNLDSGTKKSPMFVLSPLTQPAAASECRKTKRCHTLLPPISLLEQTNILSSSVTVKGCQGGGFATEEPGSRPWIDNPLLSKSRSAEFRLPDISLSSLDALLRTVTQKLEKKRRGTDEEPRRSPQSDHLLVAVSDYHKQPAKIETKKEASVGVCSVNGQGARSTFLQIKTKAPPHYDKEKPPDSKRAAMTIQKH